MRSLLLAAALLGCAGSGVGKPAAPEPEPAAREAPDDMVAAIGGAVEQYRQAYEIRAMDALEALYDRAPELVVVVEGTQYRGWDEVRGYYETLFDWVTETHVNVSRIRVLPLGEEAAVATVELRRERADGVTNVVERGLLTLVFQFGPGSLGDERWRIVAEHFSRTRRSD